MYECVCVCVCVCVYAKSKENLIITMQISILLKVLERQDRIHRGSVVAGLFGQKEWACCSRILLSP